MYSQPYLSPFRQVNKVISWYELRFVEFIFVKLRHKNTINT